MANWIHDIEIKNFKSIRHATIEDCRRVNVFIGYPNVGKSNILEGISLFEVGEISDVDLRSFLRFESYVNLFYNNDISNRIQVRLGNSEKIQIGINGKGSELRLRSESNKMFFEMVIPINDFEVNAMAHGSNASDYYDSLERLPVKKYSFTSTETGNNLNGSRELTPPFGENIANVISRNQTLKKEVIEILKQYGLKYATDEHNKIKIVKEYEDQEVKIFPYIQMADTLRRLIFYKAAITSNSNSLLLFEEPEAHMFPPYVSRFTSDVIHDGNNNQFFIATHSPFVLNDLMEDLDDKDLSIYVVGFRKETGETIIRRLADEEITEIYQYGIDLFFNLETFLKDAV